MISNDIVIRENIVLAKRVFENDVDLIRIDRDRNEKNKQIYMTKKLRTCRERGKSNRAI